MVRILRCGLDDGGEWQFVRLQGWRAVHDHCRPLEKERNDAGMPPFKFDIAYELYSALLGPFEAQIRGKLLLVAASGSLTMLPLNVLVTAPLDSKLAGVERYRKAKWLGIRQPLVTLPTVASLQALRGLGKGRHHAPRAYFGMGNPLLDGDPDDPDDVKNARLAREYTDCSKVPIAAGEGRRKPIPIESVMHGSVTDIKAVRGQRPLPETAQELCTIGKQLGTASVQEEAIWLGKRATESNLKKLSRAGTLKEFAVLHFATHGVLSAENEKILNAGSEPALILTPPAQDSDGKLEDNDGVLTASEIAQLDLNADWVLLSACNTAAPSDPNAEALSGLARAFFYAGAPALLVSHWYVDSDASVKLTTHAFMELHKDPTMARAEAMRRSMLALMQDKTRSSNWLPAVHPAIWAPFVIAGEGGR
jgi:hypothetical protein